MYDDYERKPRTATSGHVAILREAYRECPEVYAVPLAHTLWTLSDEYQRVGNLKVARRHMNSALRTMRWATAQHQVTAQSKSRIVGPLWSSCILWIFQDSPQRAVEAMDEALRWDLAYWDDHVPTWGCREMQRARMLNIKASLLKQLGRDEDAREAHADAILTALTCTSCDPVEVTDLVGSFALTVL